MICNQIIYPKKGTRKLRCSTTANGGLKWVNKKDMDATGPSVNPSKFSCKRKK